MEQLKAMKEQLTSLVQSQLSNVQNVDTKELGEAVDMIKDLAEAVYYCTITKSMEEGEKEKSYYSERRGSYPADMHMGQKMYYGAGTPSNGSNTGTSMSNGKYYSDMRIPYEYEYPMMMDMHDPREGRSAMSRRSYMESKENHQSKEYRMRELEKYIKELGQDITEMIQDTTPEEKQILKQKISTLAEKIN